MLQTLKAQFDSLILLDTETTGLNPKTDEIIEIGAFSLSLKGETPVLQEELSVLLQLSPGRKLSPFITDLTGIQQKTLEQQGLPKDLVCQKLIRLLDVERPLIAAYNAQFDLCFLYYFLHAFGQASLLKKVKMLDILTIYKDRHTYPHKLKDALQTYALQAKNTHRAIDDARAAFEVLKSMEKECPDLPKYLNLFGFNPKYGLPKPRISSITYLPQPYDEQKPLYEKIDPHQQLF